jgi:2-dehydro-3-deoxyphosphogluconate aldolase/(4S)-4-hydroxy-2-oxoglutarate aldolase
MRYDECLTVERPFPMNIRDIAKAASVVPVLSVMQLEQAVPLAQALVAGGLRVLEVALHTPVALAAVQLMRQTVPDAVIGVGGLTRAIDFAAAGRVGAQFGVSPGLTPDLAAAARGARFPLGPGVMTPTDLIGTRNAGFDVVKFLPAQQAGGVDMLALLGELFPDVAFWPTGGITLATAGDYVALPNVLCVGGSWMVPRTLVAAGDWPAIEALAREAAALKADAWKAAT